MSNHICEANSCVGHKLNGLHFMCSKCNQKFFCECMAMDRDEVLLLLNLINLIAFKDDKTPVPNVTPQSTKDFGTIFNNKSVFNFNCPNCLMKSQTEYESLKDEIAAQNVMINDMETKIKEQEKAIAEKCKMIQELTDANDNPDKIDENGAMSTQAKIMSELDALLSNKILELETKLYVEHNRLKEFCVKQINEGKTKNTNSANATRINDTPTNGKTSVRKTVQFATSLLTQQNGNVNNNSNNGSSGSGGSQNITFSEKLNPLGQMNVYALHVSKFPITTKSEAIIEHIINNTSIISPDAFKVEKISGEKADYNAYKISTFTYTLYEEIKGI